VRVVPEQDNGPQPSRALVTADNGSVSVADVRPVRA
jgi:hypothetical protein